MPQVSQRYTLPVWHPALKGDPPVGHFAVTVKTVMPIDAEAIRIASAEIETAFAGLAHRETPNCCIPNAVTMSTSWTSTVPRDWRALSDEFIVRNYATPSGFSAEAFQYYMPAFMVWSLKHHDSIEYTPESTLRALDPDA